MWHVECFQKILYKKKFISDELDQMINYDLPSKEIADYYIRGQNEPLDLVKIHQL